MDLQGYAFGCITTVGLVASAIGIFAFMTGLDTFQEAVGENAIDVEYQDFTKTIQRSAVNDYTRFVNEANSNAPRYHVLASRVSGWRSDEHTLVILDCNDRHCEEKALFETDNDETIVNAAMDTSHELVLAFTERRIVYINLRNQIFTETPYSYACNWRNHWEQQPTDRMFEEIGLSRNGPTVDIHFRFNGWTCYELTIGSARLNLRPRPTIEYNDFERYRVEMTADRLGLLTLRSSAPLQPTT